MLRCWVHTMSHATPVDGYGAGGADELHGDVDFEVLKDYPPYRRFIAPRG